MEDSDYDKIVARGIALLNRHPKVPYDWRDRISADGLNMASTVGCVAGQIFGDWYSAPGKVRHHFAFSASKDGKDYATYGDVRDYYVRLTEAWERALWPPTDPAGYTLKLDLTSYQNGALLLALSKGIRQAEDDGRAGSEYQVALVDVRAMVQGYTNAVADARLVMDSDD
jgi:hypothetical protein